MTFTTSADDLTQLPASPAEVAFIGRSNVGKSSLINALAGRKALARTSKTPGRTQLLNCFTVGSGGTVVDLPGYGWAKAPASDRARWQRRMERYLLERGPLKVTLLLLDARVAPATADLEMLAWLRANEVPFQAVATKHDKVGSSKRQKRRREVAEGCQLDPKEVLWVSAHTGVNLDRLRRLILTHLR